MRAIKSLILDIVILISFYIFSHIKVFTGKRLAEAKKVGLGGINAPKLGLFNFRHIMLISFIYKLLDF